MKQLIATVLMMVCSLSWAKWELISEDDEVSYYHNKSTMRKNGAIVRLWTIWEYSSVQTGDSGDIYKSAKELRAFNCKLETSAVISVVHYEGSMGSGKTVWSVTLLEKEWAWVPIVPESIGEATWKIACGKNSNSS